MYDQLTQQLKNLSLKDLTLIGDALDAIIEIQEKMSDTAVSVFLELLQE